MNQLSALADKADCAELLARLARGLDRRDAALLSSVFHPDATDDHGLFQGSATEFVAWVIPVLETMKRTQHVLGQMLVELDGDRAASETYFVAYHVIPGEGGDIFMIAAGRYLDRFDRRDGVWKISHRHAVYDWNRAGPSTDTADRSAPGPMTYGMPGPEDRSYAHLAFHP